MFDLPFSYESVFNLKSETDFNDFACRLFRYHYNNNSVYRDFTDYLKVGVNQIELYTDIPFLPISFFKTHTVLSKKQLAQTTFFSSGTTGSQLSKHAVADLTLYDESLLQGFNYAFGSIKDYSIFALLPSYHENKNSSLLYMVSRLIDQSTNDGGFYLDNTQQLLDDISLAKSKKKVILIGVSYALLDLADQYSPNLQDVIVVETGGMKGRRKEMTKEELHVTLKQQFKIDKIASEYGMTELLSQAWSKGDGIFSCPPWMKVITRDYTDPLNLVTNQTGGINVIDLANIHSCAFIATQDLGVIRGSNFEIKGRFDNADLRGCNLLIS